MAKYRKRPVIIEAFQWTGDFDQEEDPEWIVKAMSLPSGSSGSARVTRLCGGGVCLELTTLEGVMRASPGDYIIKGVEGEIYPCKPDIFEKTYEAID